MSYDGETLDTCGSIELDLSQASVVAVSGDGPNVCGHLLVFVNSGGAYYFHVARLHDRPRYMDQTGYRRYLTESGKSEIRRVAIPLPNPDAAFRYLESLMSGNWTWLVLPNNCVAFCEEVIKAGGGEWSSWSNCPAVATQPTIAQRASAFLADLERNIYRLYGVPGF